MKEVSSLPTLKNMYSRLQLQFDEVIHDSWQVLSKSAQSFIQRSVSTFLFQLALFFDKFVSICDVVSMYSIFTGPPAHDDLSNHFLHDTVKQLHLQKWRVKEKGWNKDSLAIYWLVWEQRIVCWLLVSSKDPVSHPAQASADRKFFCWNAFKMSFCCAELTTRVS